MNKTSQIKIILGVILAVVVIFATKVAVDNRMQPTPILVAARQIEAREQITRDMIRQESRPKTAKHALAFGTVEEFFRENQNPVARTTIFSGQQIILPMVAGKDAKGASFYIEHPNQRGVPIKVDDVSSFGNKIQIGSLVDITAVFPSKSTLNTAFSKTVAQNVKVIDIAYDTRDKNKVSVVTVAVGPEDVEILNFVQATAKLYLSLVPNTSRSKPYTPGFIPQTFLEKFAFGYETGY